MSAPLHTCGMMWFAVSRRSRGAGLSVVVLIAALLIGLDIAGPTDTATGAAFSTAYSWVNAPIDGGGFANVIAMDPANPDHIVVGGDVWGEYESTDMGSSWSPTTAGAIGIPETDARALAYSIKDPNRVFLCAGPTSSRHGAFSVITPASLTETPLTTYIDRTKRRVECGSTVPTNSHPRPTGNLIVVTDRGGTEYIFVASEQGVLRSTDGGVRWTSLGVSPDKYGAFAGMALNGSTLYVATFPYGGTSSKLYEVANATSARPRASRIATSLTDIEELDTVAGTTYVAAGTGGFYSLRGSTLKQLGSGFFQGDQTTAVAGVGRILYVGTAKHPADSAHSIAKSTNGGDTFKWVSTASHIPNYTVAGTNRTWWLSKVFPPYMLGGNGYVVAQLVVDPDNPDDVFAAGRSGVWRSENGGATWQPAVNRLEGTEASRVAVQRNGNVCNSDHDYHGEHSTDDYATIIPGLGSPCNLGTPSLTQVVHGRTYKVGLSGSVHTITINGVSVSNAVFRAATAVDPTDLAVARNGDIFISLSGGGILVGTPTGSSESTSLRPALSPAIHRARIAR